VPDGPPIRNQVEKMQGAKLPPNIDRIDMLNQHKQAAITAGSCSMEGTGEIDHGARAEAFLTRSALNLKSTMLLKL
jgi:hypothetical protein